MKGGDKLFSIAQTAKKLGGVSWNTAMKEINEAKLNACRRGKGMYCTQVQINEYKQSQIIEMPIIKVYLADYPEIDTVSV